MKIEETRLKQLIVTLALSFFWKSRNMKDIINPFEGVIDVIGETLLNNNTLLRMTFLEAIEIAESHDEKVVQKAIDIAHTNNDTDSCEGCGLFTMCFPDHVAEELKEIDIDDELRKVAIDIIQRIQNLREE